MEMITLEVDPLRALITNLCQNVPSDPFTSMPNLNSRGKSIWMLALANPRCCHFIMHLSIDDRSLARLRMLQIATSPHISIDSHGRHTNTRAMWMAPSTRKNLGCHGSIASAYLAPPMAGKESCPSPWPSWIRKEVSPTPGRSPPPLLWALLATKIPSPLLPWPPSANTLGHNHRGRLILRFHPCYLLRELYHLWEPLNRLHLLRWWFWWNPQIAPLHYPLSTRFRSIPAMWGPMKIPGDVCHPSWCCQLQKPSWSPAIKETLNMNFNALMETTMVTFQ